MPHSSTALVIGIFFGSVLSGLVEGADPIADPGFQLSYPNEIRPLLMKYCGECHQGDNAESGVAFDQLVEERAGTRDRAIWKKIHVQLSNKIMPPVDEEQPSTEERQQLLDWVNSHALTVQCNDSIYPGRVTIRRLNRAEYNNTIRDLFGVDFQPASTFPADDTGYGFDNIGDVLTLPPVLLERYLEAAEQVARRTIVASDVDFITEVKQEGGNVGGSDVGKEFEFPVEAEYLLRIRLYADQAGPDLAKLSLKLDGQEIQQYDIHAKNAEESELIEKRFKVSAGKHTLAGGFLNDYYVQADGKTEDRNLFIVSLAIAGPIGVLPSELPEPHRRLMTQTPQSNEERPVAARAILSRIVPLAWRRNVSDDEIERLVSLVTRVTDDGGSFERGIQTAIQAVLVSPRFLFRTEKDLDGDSPTAVRTLDNFELATRLSYFLWSSTPDDELLEAARRGQLSDPAELDRQTRRLLADPRSRSLVENFAGQWLQLRNLANVSPNPRRFPKFTKELRADMRRETELLFETILHEDRSVMEFLTADYTFVNQRLAEHYKIEGITGEEFRRVPVNAEQRGGLLGQASILTVTSNPTRTSPVKRGKWILDNLLASPPPPAPANVPALKESTRREPIELSLKERMSLHRTNPACSSCHVLMDPLGFGLENYDATGVWRTNDGNSDIDATGDLPDGRKFSGPKELRAILLERSDDFRRCFADRLLTYSLGRGLEYFDDCAVRKIVDQGKSEGDRVSAYILGIVHSTAFQQRGRFALPESGVVQQ